FYKQKISNWILEFNQIQIEDNFNIINEKIDDICNDLREISNNLPNDSISCYFIKYMALLKTTYKSGSLTEQLRKIIPINAWNLRGVELKKIGYIKSLKTNFSKLNWIEKGNLFFDESEYKSALYCYIKSKNGYVLGAKARELHLNNF